MIIADSKGKGYNFAKNIYEYVLRKKERDFPIDLSDIERTKFKDGEIKIKISKNVRRKKCFLIHDSNKNPYEWFTELVFKLEAINFSSPSEINVVLPYTRFARQDRKDESRVSVNAKALAQVVSLYATRGMTVDLHNPQMQEYFDIPYDNLYSFPVLVDYLQRNHKKILEDLVVVTPDLGGGKRAESLVKRLVKSGVKAEVAIGYKTRKKENEVERTMIIGNVEGKNCLIVDDIIDTGNTIIKTAEKLKEKGAKKIFVYGTHGLFTERDNEFEIFDKILVSDSLRCPKIRNLEVVSLANLFGEAIYRTIIGESLSDLFDKK